MEPLTKIPRAVFVGIVLAIVLDTVVQILWKQAVSSGIPENASLIATALAALSNQYFYLAMLFFVLQFINWIKVLAHADLSFAQPFTALSYITVLAVSSYSLHEQVNLMRLLGVSLILVGVFFISRTSHNTTGRSSTASPGTMGNGMTDG
jgi:drug/metabolite transporter (DMT)-like permease